MENWDQKTYLAAQQGVAFYTPRPCGVLRLKGEDRQAFLQRQTTNDVRALAAGLCILTVLTSPVARILDVLTLVGETDAIRVITLPGRAEATAGFLRSRIFFMDRVEVLDESQQLAQIDLLGPGSSALLGEFGFHAGQRPDQVLSLNMDGIAVVCWAQPPFLAAGYRLLFPADESSRLIALLSSLGAARLMEQEFDTLRIEAGLPGVDTELKEEFTPLEAGLEAIVSTQKGCFTGQEVIARQLTYDKVTQHLCSLRLEDPVSAGWRLWAKEGRPAGVITSYTESPSFGPIGLAMVRRPFDEVGSRLRVGISATEGCWAEVVEKPMKA